MNTEKYYVAIENKVLLPTIVETFDTKKQALDYAHLMSEAKQRNYIVLDVLAIYENKNEDE